MSWIGRNRRRKHCPHSDLRGIYGDEINHTPGGRRLECRDCGRLLDGHVGVAEWRRDEWAKRMEHVRVALNASWDARQARGEPR